MTTESHIKYDPVSLPKHYQLKGGKEVLDYLLDITNALPSELSYVLGNALKYIGRAPRKEHLQEDLEKAMYYSQVAKQKEIAGIYLKSYKKHLKKVDVIQLQQDLAEFGRFTADTYPKELQQPVMTAICVWEQFFRDIVSSKGRVKLSRGQLSYVVYEWVFALATLNEAVRRYEQGK